MSEDQSVERLSVAEAAEALGVTRDAIHKRIKRGSIKHEKGEDGRFYVFVDTSTSELDESVDKSKDESKVEVLERLIEGQEDRIAFLEREMERRGDETERLHQIVAGLAQATAEQARTIRAIEAPAEAPEDAETIDEAPERSESQPAAAGPQDGTEPAPGTTEGAEATQQEEEPQAREAMGGDSGDWALPGSREQLSEVAVGSGPVEGSHAAQEPEAAEPGSAAEEDVQRDYPGDLPSVGQQKGESQDSVEAEREPDEEELRAGRTGDFESRMEEFGRRREAQRREREEFERRMEERRAAERQQDQQRRPWWRRVIGR